ncbi:M48 family metalloprotease [Mangrovimicrobium sediminis]|nr:M48 family metalloprotease [Haliea sp. SAOS-164]
MKRHLCKVLLGLSVLVFSSQALSGRYLDHKDVKRSSLYTGKPECDALAHESAQVWQAGLDIKEQRKSQLEYHGFLLEDRSLDQKLSSIVNKLVGGFPGKCPDVNLFVMAEGSPLMFEAMTSSIGEIFIHYGVISQAESEDELAGVIAHELAHVYLGHVEKIDLGREMFELMESTSSWRELYSVSENTDYDKEKHRLESDRQELDEDVRKIAYQEKLAKRHYVALHASLFSRSAEFDADRLAVDLLLGAGYSPVAMTHVLERIGKSYDAMQELQAEATEAAQAMVVDNLEYLASTGAGEASMEDHLKESAEDTWNVLQERGESVINDILRSSHPKTEDRIEEVNQYLLEEFTRGDRRPPSVAPVLSLDGGYIGSLIGNVEAANASFVALANGEVPAAEKSALKAISTPTAESGYARYIAFLVRGEQKKRDLAMRNLQSMGDTQWMPIEATAEIVDNLIAWDQLGSAQSLYRNKASYAEDSDYFYPLKIHMLLAERQVDESKNIAQQCVDRRGIATWIADECGRLAGLEPRKKSSPLDFFSDAVKKLPFGKDE